MVIKFRNYQVEYLITAEFLHKSKRIKIRLQLSFWVAHLWAKQGRSFTNDELFVFVVAEEMCPENINLVKTASLSAETVAWRVEDVGSDISSKLKTR